MKLTLFVRRFFSFSSDDASCDQALDVILVIACVGFVMSCVGIGVWVWGLWETVS